MSLLLAAGWLILLTLIPGLEARMSLPFAFFHSSVREALGLPLAITICLLANLLVGVMTFWLMGPVVHLFRRWPFFERRIWPHFAKTQHKLHPYVEKYGEWGLAFFIGIPLPGTGAYTGAFGAFLLGFDKRRFFLANLFGVLLACTAITAICVLIEKGAVSEDSLIRKIFIKELVEHE
ncbi:MAG: small multi-drug export protein [Kiritimatiellae bacterium]|nr:small multi-drug export protein [Kiritimatiellia bacterium]